MSAVPNPARLAEYEARLADLFAARDAARTLHNDQQVRLINRRIHAQIKWIRRAQSASS